MKMKATCTALLLLISSGSAIGQELVGGWEGGPSNGYGFVMPVFSIPKQGPNAFVVRPSIGYLYYNFREAGGFTNVTSPGASLGVAYRLRKKKATLTIGPGFEARWEHRVQADGSQININRRGFVGQGDIYYSATAFTAFTLNGSYELSNHYVWSRAGFKHQVTNRSFEGGTALLFGAEVTTQGNRDVHQMQVGPLLELALRPLHGALQFHSGYARLQFADGSQETRPYFGAGIYRVF